MSSTFDDLKGHRARVIEAFQKSGLIALSSDDVASAPDLPQDLIRDTIAGSDLFVLLVAFRRGYVPPGDSLSNVELEYQAALDLGIDSMVFMLDEEAPWPRRFDELDKDPGIRMFREELLERHGVSFFGLEPTSVLIKPAIAQWVAARRQDSETEQEARARVEQLGDYTSTAELTQKIRGVETDVDSIIDEVPETVPKMLEAYRTALDWDGLVAFVDKLDPDLQDDPTVVIEYAMALARRRQNGDIDRSIQLVEDAVNRNSHDSELHSILAGRYRDRWQESEEAADLDRAISTYERAFELDQSNWYAGLEWVGLMHNRGDDTSDVRATAFGVREAFHRERGPKYAWDFSDVLTDLSLALLAEDWDSASSDARRLDDMSVDRWILDSARDGIEPLLQAAPGQVAAEVWQTLSPQDGSDV